MADKSQHQGGQSYQQNQGWDQNRDRFNQENENRNQYGNYGNISDYKQDQQMKQGGYGSSGYSGDSARGREMENQGSYGKVNYMPDNDYNRNYQDRDYESNQYGSSGIYGHRRSAGQDYNSTGYTGTGNMGHRENFGNAGYGSGYQGNDWNRREGYGNTSFGNQNTSFGNQNRNEGDWYRHQQQWGNSGMMGGEYERQDWRRSNANAGYYTDDPGRMYSGNYNEDYQYGSNWNRPYDEQRMHRGYRSDYDGGFGATGNTYADQGSHQWPAARNYGNNFESPNYRRDRGWWEKTADEVSSWFGDEEAERRRRIDNIMDNRGKGPRNYERSQDRIREDVCDRLTDDDLVDASNIEVQVQGAEVILAGTVNSREEKRRAEDIVESIPGVRNVENRIRVGSAYERSFPDDSARSAMTANTTTTPGTQQTSSTPGTPATETTTNTKSRNR